jgi:hypothetical protein
MFYKTSSTYTLVLGWFVRLCPTEKSSLVCLQWLYVHCKVPSMRSPLSHLNMILLSILVKCHATVLLGKSSFVLKVVGKYSFMLTLIQWWKLQNVAFFSCWIVGKKKRKNLALNGALGKFLAVEWVRWWAVWTSQLEEDRNLDHNAEHAGTSIQRFSSAERVAS